MQKGTPQTTMEAVAFLVRRFLSAVDDGVSAIAAIEFAIIAPVLVLTTISMADLGMGIYRRMQVQNAAQAGATYAVTNGFAADAISSAVENATSFSGIVASPPPIQFCGCASSTGVTAIACTSTCSEGLPAGTYVRVSTQATYNTILPYPLIPSSFTFTAQSTVRLQ